MRTFEEILKDVRNSCKEILFYGYGIKDIAMPSVIEAATKIYIAELEAESYKMAREDIF